MKLYATITSERDSRAGKKGGNEYLRIELSAFGKVIGYVLLEITGGDNGDRMQYLLKFAQHQDSHDWVNLKEGH